MATASPQSLAEKIAALRHERGLPHRESVGVQVSELRDSLPKEDSALPSVSEQQEDDAFDGTLAEALLDEHDQLTDDLRVLKSVYSWMMGMNELLSQSSIPTSEKRLQRGVLLERILPHYEEYLVSVETHLADIQLELSDLHDARGV